MLAQAGQRAKVAVPAWLTEGYDPGIQEASGAQSTSMQRSSRASSLNSEAQNVANEAADAGPSDSAGRSPAERSTRKRKADSDEGPGLELAEQPKQQKQKVAYAAYIDSRTGELKQLKPLPPFSWTLNAQAPEEEDLIKSRRRIRRSRPRAVGPITTRKHLRDSSQHPPELLDWVEGEEGRPVKVAKTPLALQSVEKPKPSQEQIPDSQTVSTGKALKPLSLEKSLKKGPSLVNLQELASESLSKPLGSKAGSIFSFPTQSPLLQETETQTAPAFSAEVKPASEEGMKQPPAETNAAAPKAEKNNEAANLVSSDISNNRLSSAEPKVADTATKSSLPGFTGGGTTLAPLSDSTFAFGAGSSAAMSQATATSTTSFPALPFAFNAGSSASTTKPEAPVAGQKSNPAFTFGTQNASALKPTAAKPQTATSFTFGAATSMASQSTSPFTFGSSNPAASNAQTTPVFNTAIGSTPATPSAFQAAAPQATPVAQSGFLGARSAVPGATERQAPAMGGQFIFGSNPASSGSGFVANKQPSTAPSAFFGTPQAAIITTGNPFSGASVPAFNASSGSSGLQTASVAQNPFAANSATQGHTLGLAGLGNGGVQGSTPQAHPFASSMATSGSGPVSFPGNPSSISSMNASSSVPATGFSFGGSTNTQGSLSANPFAGSSAPAFGGTAASTGNAFGNAFGASSKAAGSGAFPFGNNQSSSSGAFGAAMSPSSFGGATQSGGFTFGNPASAPGFSANQPGSNPSVMGGPAPNPFGGGQQSFGNTPNFAFGQPPTAAQSAPAIGPMAQNPSFGMGAAPGAMTMGGAPGAMTLGGTGAPVARRKLVRRRG